MSTVHRAAAAVMAAVAVLAGLVALTAAAWAGDRCADLPGDAGGSHEVCGPVLERYRAEGGDAGLGRPVADEGPVTLVSARRFGDREQAFTGGTVYLDRESGTTSVGRWYAYTPLR